MGHDESLSEQEILGGVNKCVPSFVGGVVLYEHQGWESTSCRLMQVSNAVFPNTNGNVQLSQPVDRGYVGGALVGDQIARNPVRGKELSEKNLMVIEFVSVMMLQGFAVSPQCMEL